jgi:hypothetical protein
VGENSFNFRKTSNFSRVFNSMISTSFEQGLKIKIGDRVIPLNDLLLTVPWKLFLLAGILNN